MSLEDGEVGEPDIHLLEAVSANQREKNEELRRYCIRGELERTARSLEALWRTGLHPISRGILTRAPSPVPNSYPLVGTFSPLLSATASGRSGELIHRFPGVPRRP
jgi:hypothetical protein